MSDREDIARALRMHKEAQQGETSLRIFEFLMVSICLSVKRDTCHGDRQLLSNMGPITTQGFPFRESGFKIWILLFCVYTVKSKCKQLWHVYKTSRKRPAEQLTVWLTLKNFIFWGTWTEKWRWLPAVWPQLCMCNVRWCIQAAAGRLQQDKVDPVIPSAC